MLAMDTKPASPARRAARKVLRALASGIDSVIRMGEVGTRLRFPRER
jgi:hypothetical protein